MDTTFSAIDLSKKLLYGEIIVLLLSTIIKINKLLYPINYCFRKTKTEKRNYCTEKLMFGVVKFLWATSVKTYIQKPYYVIVKTYIHELYFSNYLYYKKRKWSKPKLLVHKN